MNPIDLMTQALTVERRGTTTRDRNGNAIAGTASTYVTTGYIEQTGAKEVTVDRETYTSDWLAMLPTGSSLDSSDRITYDGQTFEVLGPPHRVWNPRKRVESHVECRLRVTTG